MSYGQYVHLDVERVVRETEKALLLLVEGEELWVPKSVVSAPGEYAEGDENCTVSVAAWWAGKNGLP